MLSDDDAYEYAIVCEADGQVSRIFTCLNKRDALNLAARCNDALPRAAGQRWVPRRKLRVDWEPLAAADTSE